jgi:RNA polymerase sigma-70 factor (ECF subfamily)
MFQWSLNSPPPPLPAPDTPEMELVERARAGDRAAFTALFQQYYAPIWRYLTHLVGDEEIGRDLAQETFLAAWRSLPGMQEGLRFSAWLYRIATNQAYTHLRRARLITWLPFADSEAGSGVRHPTVAGPETRVSEAELLALALAEVTPKYRACLLLQVQEGFSQREIGQLLHLSEKSVGICVSRGREQFRKAYLRLNPVFARARKRGTAQ